MTAEWLPSYLAAIRAGDRRRAFALVDQACAARLSLRTLYLDVFQPALREIGRLWQENEITVAEEHLATAITEIAMARLYSALLVTSPRPGCTLVAACADGERHEVGLRMVCDLAEEQGWDAVFLGASVPLDSLVAMVRERRPRVVALSASIAPHLPEVRATIHAVRRAGEPAPFILVGGRPFVDDPDLAPRLGADATARDAAHAVELLQERFA
jgi:methanogenic corrinoid protein MtbC1